LNLKHLNRQLLRLDESTNNQSNFTAEPIWWLLNT